MDTAQNSPSGISKLVLQKVFFALRFQTEDVRSPAAHHGISAVPSIKRHSSARGSDAIISSAGTQLQPVNTDVCARLMINSASALRSECTLKSAEALAALE